MPQYEDDPVVSVSHSEHGGVVGVNDFAPASPPGAGGNGGWFESAQGEGVRGWAKSAAHGGVVGVNTAGGIGVYGTSDDGPGMYGESKNNEGVHGVSHNAHGGVVGVNDWAPASPAGAGGNGGWFESAQGEGVRGWAKSAAHGGVVGVNTAGGVGVYGKSEGGAAGHFDGDAHVSGVLKVEGDIQLTGADLAEQFEVVGDLPAEPGCVVVLAGNDRVRVSDAPYDRRVAGVVSGAGSYRPGLVLDNTGGADRRPLALTGKVWCHVDADCASVELGDLLTTSPRPGYAMRAADPARAIGAVIGKALASLPSGRGLIPVLVTLQ